MGTGLGLEWEKGLGKRWEMELWERWEQVVMWAMPWPSGWRRSSWEWHGCRMVKSGAAWDWQAARRN